jgi:hypothetical protein
MAITAEMPPASGLISGRSLAAAALIVCYLSFIPYIQVRYSCFAMR